MLIGVAQIGSVKGDIKGNIESHKILIKLASTLGSTALFFPELSLTGYESKIAKELATEWESNFFDVFQQTSNVNKITIGIGMPINSESGIQIGMIIFQPDYSRQLYSKQELHADEVPYFVPGDRQLILSIENMKIAPAICYEILLPKHAEMAVQMGAQVYIASVAKSQMGLDKALIHYPEIAYKYSMPVLMANCVGDCDDFMGVGRSSIWNKEGKLIGQLDEKSEGLLVFDTETEEVFE